MSGAQITPNDNGPLMVQGAFKLVDVEGREFALDRDKIYLCRCGASNNKPFCDGSHRRIGFESQVRAPN
ncbi:MAG TPA: CDGSH iron-sulfur domain-containing protein [Bacillota bacterium]